MQSLFSKDWMRALVVLTFFVLLFATTYFSVETVSSFDDHFFHFRFAEQVRNHGLLKSFYDFKSIYFSKMAHGPQYFVYYNFIFYLLLVPFSFITPLFVAIKLYAVFAVSATLALFYWCLRKFGVRGALFWTLAVFSIAGTSSLFRFFLSRPYTLAPILLILLLYFLNKKKYLGVFFINLIYLFWHSSTFFFPLCVTILYLLFEKFYGDRGDYKNLLAGLGGNVAALSIVYAIAPGFLVFIYDTVFGIYKETILGKSVSLPEGQELYPVEFFDFLRMNQFIVCVFVVSVVIYIYQYIAWRRSADDASSSHEDYSRMHVVGVSFFLSLSFFLGTVAVSARFGDYFVFLAGLFIVLVLSDVLRNVRIDSATVAKAVKVGVITSVAYLFASNMIFLQEGFARGARTDNWHSVGEWLNNNVPKEEIIFNTSWNWFPQLYYESPSHNYVIGLEPRFMYVYDQELYWKWYHIGTDAYLCGKEDCMDLVSESHRVARNDSLKKSWYQKQGDDIAQSLKKDFHTSYIITTKNYKALNDIMDNNKRFAKKFESDKGQIIYEVI